MYFTSTWHLDCIKPLFQRYLGSMSESSRARRESRARKECESVESSGPRAYF